MIKKLLLLSVTVIFAVLAGSLFYFFNTGDKTLQARTPREISKMWSGGKCIGSGSIPLTASPLALDDLDSVAPMGNMVGFHITPSDHLGFAPKNPTKDTTVSAIAKGFVVNLEYVKESNKEWYGVKIEHSCTFYSNQYLISNLSEPFKSALGTKNYAAVRIPVESGQIIGTIRDHGMDYWLADLNSKLDFVNPDRYNNELWKVYVVDPFNFFEEPLRTKLLGRNIREADPPGGKINYDVDKTLAGNWFKETYVQTYNAEKDAVNTLTFGNDFIEPSIRILSIGDFNGQAKQFALISTDPDPRDVNISSGLVKYSLVNWSYRLPDGSDWNRMSLTKGKQGYTQEQFVQATVLVQLTSDRMLKLEIFPNKKAEEVRGFTSKAKTYLR